MGEVSGRRLAGMRCFDLVVHAWDLARATGGDEDLPADLATDLVAQLQPAAAYLAGSGAFGQGTSGDLPDDAPALHRLLDLTGRRP
jgi:uncharacterized protein (TIGR03086 family)